MLHVAQLVVHWRRSRIRSQPWSIEFADIVVTGSPKP